jgi:hypothetical protein
MADTFRLRLDFIGEFRGVSEAGNTADNIIQKITEEMDEVVYDGVMIENLETEE